MTAGDAARFADRLAAVPEHARIFVLPPDGERLVHLDILARLDATAAEHALVGVVAVKGIGRIDLVRLRLELDALVLHVKHLGRVVDLAVLVVVVADGAIEKVVGEDVVERLPLRGIGPGRLCFHAHPGGDLRGAGPHQLAVHLDHAGVAGLQGAKLVVVADVGNLGLMAHQQIDEQLALGGLDTLPIE